MFSFPALSVHKLTKHIKSLFDNDFSLQDIWVKGELSNFKKHTSGHVYFTLKDELSSIRCVMFKSKAVRINQYPKNGDNLLVRGSVNVYEKGGSYQLYAEEIHLDGIGVLHQAYEKLKSDLEKEGLFDTKYKKKIPKIPRKIGIVTSKTGAALKDIITVIRRRYPNSHLVVAPVRVQGEGAPDEIAAGIRNIQRVKNIDVIILGRGGGSFEELNAFNSELVARDIFNCPLPIISAVGHETDFTIADFVADVRAPTPSAAAELVVPDKTEVNKMLTTMKAKADYLVVKKVEIERNKINHIKERRSIKKPKSFIDQERQNLDYLMRNSQNAVSKSLSMAKERCRSLAGKAQALSPLSILERGYSIVMKHPSQIRIRSIADIDKNDKITTVLLDGKIESKVESVKEEDIRHGKK